MDFVSYWKEISVVLAALFAIAGTVFEVRDKASHRITIWGRVFFGLTLLSMIGGFYAQWEENTSDAARNKRSQNEMLKVIENTNRNVYDLSRILQPLGRSNIYLTFTPNCIELKDFCDATIKEGEREAPSDKNISSYTIDPVVWSKWPNRTNVPSISLLFFKDRGQAKKFVETGCSACKSGDMSFSLYFNTSEIVASNISVQVMYVIDTGQLYIGAANNDITPNVNNDKMLSTIDLPGSTLIVQETSDTQTLFKNLTLISITIHTDRGQTIDIENPTRVNSKDATLFEYVFPDAPQH